MWLLMRRLNLAEVVLTWMLLDRHTWGDSVDLCLAGTVTIGTIETAQT